MTMPHVSNLIFTAVSSDHGYSVVDVSTVADDIGGHVVCFPNRMLIMLNVCTANVSNAKNVLTRN